MDGTTRPLAALLLVSLSGTACSFTTTPEAKSVQLPTQPAATAQAQAQQEKLDVQFATARTFEQEGDLDRAASLYRAILAQNSRHAGATHRLAIICDQQGQHEEALKLFQRALDLRPGNPDLYCDLGYSFYCKQQWAQAERHLRLALEADPQHSRSHHHLGLTLAAQAKDGVALREFQKAGCTTAQARANLAQMQTFTGRLEEAARNCELARKSDPNNTQLHSELQELETIIARAEAAQPEATEPQVMMAQADPQPRTSPIWRVAFESRSSRNPAAEPEPTPARLPQAASKNSPSPSVIEQASKEEKQAQAPEKQTQAATEQQDAAAEGAEPADEQAAAAAPEQSRWRQLFRWRRAERGENK